MSRSEHLTFVGVAAQKICMAHLPVEHNMVLHVVSNLAWCL